MSASRRDFLKTAGCLSIGFCLAGRACDIPAAAQPAAPPAEDAINAWLEILDDGAVRVLTGKIELGQGISTAVAQVAAEELDMDMARVKVIIAETGRTPNEGYTAGSGSIESSAMAIRRAAAAARQKLLELAAARMQAQQSDLRLANGSITHTTTGKALSFAEVLDGRQLAGTIPSDVPFKPKDTYRIVGKAVPRQNLQQMVKGEPVYVHDLRFPGMVHARVVRPPAYEARLLRFDDHGIRNKILKTVVNGSFLAVIAATEYEAIQAQQWLRAHSHWTAGKTLPLVSGPQLADYIKNLPVQTQQVTRKGTGNPPAAGSIKARYFKPYIMHGAIGPSCAVALYQAGKLDVWTHSQGVYPLREALAKLLQLPADAIHVKGVPGAGCYGHNGADDVAADAALLAMAYPGKHIRVQWEREEEHAWEPFGSAMNMEVEASLDNTGRISYWKYALWSDSHGTRPGGNPGNLLAAHYLEQPFTERGPGFSGGAYRNAVPYYSIPLLQVDAHFFDGPLRTSSLRSLGAYANIFAIESFMDELAEKAGQDPYTFRLAHLEDERAKAVITQLQAMVQPTGTATTAQQDGMRTGTGFAFSRYKNTGAYCAVAAQVAATPKNTIQVKQMWAVVDAGEVINLTGIKNQIEGGMVQSASWTLQEQVRFNEQHVTSLHWYTYPVFRFNQAPLVDVSVINRPDQPALGAGEAAQGPAAAAIANAVYRATGKRIRYLPVNGGQPVS
jgi:CO/xanthine dehydrogenase Mo-binding subunit